MQRRSRSIALLVGAAAVAGLAAAAHQNAPRAAPQSASDPAARTPRAPADYRNKYVVYGTLTAGLSESSGLVASRKHPGVYWSHNDSGNPAELFAIDDTGRGLGVWRVAGADNRDWEDIEIDDHGQILIADTGNNEKKDRAARILIITEPAQPAQRSTLAVRATWSFKYPGQQQNCEAFFAWKDHWYIIEKLGAPLMPSDRPANLYEVVRDQPATTAGNRNAVLKKAEEFDFRGPVTAARLSPDGKTLAVATYTAMFVFDRPDAGGPFFAGKPHVTPLLCGQMEAVAFCHDGSGDLLMTNEGREVYRLTRDWYLSGRPFVSGAHFKKSGR